MGENPLLLIIWIRKMGKFALRRGNLTDFWENRENPPAGGEIPGFPRPPEKSRNFQGAVFGGGRNAKIGPIRSSTFGRFLQKVILRTIGPPVIYCTKNLENLTNFVPTGRVIKYPTKCALFLSRAGGRPGRVPGRGGGTPDLGGKSTKFADFPGFGRFIFNLYV